MFSVFATTIVNVRTPPLLESDEIDKLVTDSVLFELANRSEFHVAKMVTLLALNVS